MIAVKVPVEVVTEYCETSAWLKSVTNTQLSSPRIVIEVGIRPVATVGGVKGDTAPDTGAIFNWETVLEYMPTTYTLFPYGSTTMGPIPCTLPLREKGEPATAISEPGCCCAAQVGDCVFKPLQMV